MNATKLDHALATLDHSVDFRRRTTAELPALLPVAPSPTRSGRASRHWKLFAWPVAALLVAVPTVAFLASGSESHTVAPHDAEVHAGSRRAVHVVRPERGAGSSVALPATIRPWQTASLHARVSGYLASWHADLGKTVKAGELLAVIDTPELDQELAQAEALAQEGLAAVAQAKAEREEAESDLKVAQAQLVRVEAEVALAMSQLARRDKLRASQAISTEEYDTALRQLEARNAEAAAAKSDVDRRRSNLDTRASVIKAREATANSRQSNVERLEELQAFKRIVAPFDGVVTRRTAEVGMLLSPGADPIFVVEDNSRVRVQVNVPQAYATQARENSVATVAIPEAAEPAATGTIARTSESVDEKSRTLLAEIELDNTDHRYHPGSYAQVMLSTKESSTSWAIPTSAVLMRVEGSFVALLTPDDKVELQPVRLGRDFGSKVSVLEGITGDERLVVNPTEDLASGTAVTIAAQSPATLAVAKR